MSTGPGSIQVPVRDEALSQRAQACVVLGCAGLPDRDFRTIHKLAGYGFFRAGGVLVGPYGFAAIGNMLGVRWAKGTEARASAPAEAGHNICIGVPAEFEIPTHDAITALEVGQNPAREFAGYKGSRRASSEHDLPIDFLTPDIGGNTAIAMPGLRIQLKPSKFLEFLLEDTTQGVAFGKSGACLVTLPDPARLALNRLMVSVRGRTAERSKSGIELEQAAALIAWHIDHGREAHIREVCQQALLGPVNTNCTEAISLRQ